MTLLTERDNSAVGNNPDDAVAKEGARSAETLGIPWDKLVKAWNEDPWGYADKIRTGANSLASAYKNSQDTARLSEKAEVEQRIAEYNAQRRMAQANLSLYNTNRQISNITRKYGEMQGKRKVSAASRGIVAGYGSDKDVQATLDLYKQIDANTAYANGIAVAMGYMNKSTADKMIAAARGVDASLKNEFTFWGDDLWRTER